MATPVAIPKTSEEALEEVEEYNQLPRVIFNSSRYYGLPWELMSMIYQGAPITEVEALGYHESLTTTTTTSGCSTILEDGNDELKALLAVSKSFSNKLSSYLDRSLPTHVALSAELHLAGEQSITTFQIKNLDKMLPSSAAGLYIDIKCDVIQELIKSQSIDELRATAAERTFELGAATLTESTFTAADTNYGIGCPSIEQNYHSRPTEAEAHTAISQTPAFDDLLHRLRACTNTQDIILRLDISNDLCLDEQDPEVQLSTRLPAPHRSDRKRAKSQEVLRASRSFRNVCLSRDWTGLVR